MGIRLTTSIFPAIVFGIATMVLFFYPITKKLNVTMQNELDERRANQ